MRKILATSLLTIFLAALAFSAMGASFGGGIKSIQQGTGTEPVAANAVDTVNVTVTATVLAKSVVQAWVATDRGTYSNANIAPVLTSTTNLRLFMDCGGIATNATVTYTWQIIEYY